ncbi:metallophosphoesterase family protein [Dyadobacter psychrotolerans]|uniref:Twin-arginine translocation signal domain-containing protein n=1 Tax=Dyadobacter psychrotolerans TaxID=2541721 RepID=A0A4R5DF96_9BACT|nr:metallophosphoesterase [Dyadobacter psychrotolerans]TDE09043.1 twin-arginine translocation signal domain-containing protein [Dyadobacter psychrotolerans]
MPNRRSFLKDIGIAAGATLLTSSCFAIPASQTASHKKLRFGFITDLHHLQFGKNEQARIKSFISSVLKENPDFIVQCGDFCRHTNSDEIMAEWNRFKGPKYHVLGNHDMDFCDKATIMKFWNMPKRYYSFDKDGFHFVVMDRNFLKKQDGSLVDYDTSNWGPFAWPQRSFTDQAQLDWLRDDLAAAQFAVIVFMHQPVFLSDFYQETGNADDILKIFDQANLNATRKKTGNKIAAVFMGHDHDDRHGQRNGVHYFIMNSASYVYTNSGAHYYKDPLYAFITLDPAGILTIEGRSSTYRDQTPDVVRARFPTRISNHKVGF